MGRVLLKGDFRMKWKGILDCIELFHLSENDSKLNKLSPPPPLNSDI